MYKRIMTVTMITMMGLSLSAQNKDNENKLESASTPNKKVKVFLLGGQSNMMGIGSISKLKPPYNETSKLFRVFHKGQWQFFKPGLLNQKKRFGPEVSFGHSVAQAYPDVDIRLVKYAQGGTNLYQQWSPQLKGKQYKRFMEHARAALADLDKNGIKYEVAAMLWLQGEADANKGKGDLYEKNLTQFIKHMRTEFKTPEMPFILARIRDYYGKETGHNKFVRDAQGKVADTMKNVTCFDTDDCSMKNKGHYDADGYIEIGKRFTKAYQHPDQPLEQKKAEPKKEITKKKKKQKKQKKENK